MGNSLVAQRLGLCCSVAQSCLTLCDPMDCSTPGFPVLHHRPDPAHTHVHWVGDTNQSSYVVRPKKKKSVLIETILEYLGRLWSPSSSEHCPELVRRRLHWWRSKRFLAGPEHCLQSSLILTNIYETKGLTSSFLPLQIPMKLNPQPLK